MELITSNIALQAVPAATAARIVALELLPVLLERRLEVSA